MFALFHLSMCGIAGYSGKGNESVLTRMNDTLTHRGPDDSGMQIFPRPKGFGSVGLAQRRLAIVDLSPAGHQPMSNESGSVWVAFNGEIYNHVALRAMLGHNHTFKGGSDTEVIVHLYEELGPTVFSKLEGMFAIALYDTKKDMLYLARDRMGKKPLYWSVQDETLLFGSELKALMAHPSFKKEIDASSLNKYFLYEYVPTPHTIFSHTFKLEPGTYIAWKEGVAHKEQFWKPHFLPKYEGTFEEALFELDKRLETATRSRLMADVPLGVFLSGGIDSSAVAYYAVHTSTEKVRTFSVGFDEPSFDESRFARTVAKHLNTEHTEHTLRVQDCLSLVPGIGELLDEPMADASIVPTALLSKHTREKVTVALGGDGGDELFCGYDTFLAHRFAGMYERVPECMRKRVAQLVARLPTAHSNMSLDFKLKKFTRDFEGEARYRDQRWLGAFSDSERGELFSEDVWRAVGGNNVYEDIDRYFGEADSKERFDALAYVYERMYMMDQVLVKVDRASMMHALEVRAPFLDAAVVDFANRLPTRFKFHGLERKYILKKLMEGKLPREIVYRKKKGFGMPVGVWLRGPLLSLMEDLLSEGSLAQMGFFNASYIARLKKEHLDGMCDHRKKLWTLLVFVLWWRKWVG